MKLESLGRELVSVENFIWSYSANGASVIMDYTIL